MAAVAVLVLFLQAPAGVDQKRVDDAIRRGAEYLKRAASPVAYEDEKDKTVANSDELIALTLLHAGVPRDDVRLRELVKKILESKLTRTYSVSLQAMVFEELDRVRHQARIWQCAQFLVDNQCRNGQWSYGMPTVAVENVPTPAPRADVATWAGAPVSRSGKPAVAQRLPVQKTRTGPEVGDNSNSQYAALGLRACHDAGVILPKETIQLASSEWKHSLKIELGTGYTTGGWGYRVEDKDVAYASMTAGAIGSVVIYDAILGKDWKKNPAALAGLNWLARGFSVVKNEGQEKRGRKPDRWLCYYLYALERAGILYGTEKLGRHAWYPAGAKVLLEAQRADGSWESSEPREPVWDTCFAILFLRRATRPLEDVVTGDRLKKP